MVYGLGVIRAQGLESLGLRRGLFVGSFRLEGFGGSTLSKALKPQKPGPPELKEDYAETTRILNYETSGNKQQPAP